MEFLDKLVLAIIRDYPLFKEYLILGPYLEQNSILSQLDMSLTVILKFNKTRMDFVFCTPSVGYLYNFYYRKGNINYLFLLKLLYVKGILSGPIFVKKVYKSLVFTLCK